MLDQNALAAASTGLGSSEHVIRKQSNSVDVHSVQHSLQWDWQKVTSHTVNDIDSLAKLLDLDKTALNHQCENNAFQLRVPLPFVSRMRKGDLTDPLLLQVLPLKRESQNVAGNHYDALDEQTYNVRPGLVHKYNGRVLLTAAVSCPINCRYCFRRHFPYEENRLTPSNWQPALDYIREHESITEVILSGGEPLMLNDHLFSRLLDEIEAIEHVNHIRIHTRYPIAVPQRLTPELCKRLSIAQCNVAMVLHCNHPHEIDQHVKHHLSPLVNSRVTLLNQSVLLKGINDDVETLSNLSESLYNAGVLPYYLHATDPVVGTAHFQVSDERAQALALKLSYMLPGYLLPTLVREVPGKKAKTRLPLAPATPL
ncbi:UNVERIFIED_CONTAM: hypothetical protein GTU68_055743 [Idotea baltica]|nr:hypothetical protein [Idotea baltica]